MRLYLDHLAATPVHPDVAAAMRPWLESAWGNPSNLHQHGLAAAEAVQAARAEAAAFAGVASEEIVFTSGGTEAANAALCGIAWKRGPGSILCSAAEHPSILATARFLESQGHERVLIPVDGEGRINPEDVRRALRPDTRLVCVHRSNPDSGCIQDVAALAAVAHEAGVPVFCDATTSGGWVPSTRQALGADLISYSPHRFFGPKGVGCLVVRKGLELEPLLHGGRQEGGRRAGTENVAGIVGAGVACRRAQSGMEAWARETAPLRDRLWQALREAVPGLHLHGPLTGPLRDPRHLAVGIEGVEGEALMLLLDLRGVACTAASGCLSGAEKYSKVLRAMRVPEELVKGTLILSPGPGQTLDQMEQAAGIIAQAVAKIRAM